MDTFEKVVEYLYDIPRFTKKNSLDHTKALLKELGDPQEKFKILHVAGSNGKGSVCMFLNCMLQKTGKKVGLFTSPHLVDIRERFQIDGQMCGKEEFLTAFSIVEQAVEKMQKKNLPHPTFFEIIFAIGMVIFARADVEYVVLETGLGGRLDATNAVAHPILTIITSISLEHTEYLGDTIVQIAGEKAGIIKPGIPVVYDGTEEAAAAVIARRAKELSCPVCEISSQMCKINEIKRNFIDFCLLTEYDNGTRWKIPFVADYQTRNAALAITGIRMLQQLNKGKMDKMDSVIEELTDAQAADALMHARWPGRMEEILPEVYLDGGHNVAGIREFIKTASRLVKEDKISPILLFSMVKDKDYSHAVEILSSEMCWNQIIVTSIPNARGLSVQELEQVFQQVQQDNICGITDCGKAFEAAMDAKKVGQKLFCTGSLYFVGALKEYLQTKERSSQNDQF